MKGSPLVRIPLAVQKRYGADHAGYLAANMAYYGFLSVFPLLLLAMSAIGFFLVRRPDAQLEWANRLSATIPGLGPLIGKNMRALVEGRGGTGLIGIGGLLWTGTALAEAAGYSLSTVYRVPEYGNVLRKKLWAIGCTAGLGALAASGAVLAGMVGGSRRGVGLRMSAFVLAFALDFVLFLVAYRVLTQRRGPPCRALWKGALFAAAGWTALKVLGAWYASRTVASSAEVYGTFGSVVGILALLYLASRLFLYGAELNVVLAEEGGQPDMTTDGELKQRPMKPPQEQTTPELVGSIAGDVGILVHKELELARQELTEAVTARLKAAGATAGAGAAGLVALIFLALAAADGLANVMPVWASRLVVGGIFLALTGAAAAFEAAELRQQRRMNRALMARLEHG